jgi:hypothetical protein
MWQIKFINLWVCKILLDERPKFSRIIRYKTIILPKFKEFRFYCILSIDHLTMDELFEDWRMRSGKAIIQTDTLESINKSQIPMFFLKDIFHLLSNTPSSMYNVKWQNLKGIDFSGDH